MTTKGREKVMNIDLVKIIEKQITTLSEKSDESVTTEELVALSKAVTGLCYLLIDYQKFYNQ